MKVTLWFVDLLIKDSGIYELELEDGDRVVSVETYELAGEFRYRVWIERQSA